MNVESLKDKIKDYGKDIRLNLSNLLTVEGGALTEKQRAGLFLCSSYATKNEDLIRYAEALVEAALTEQELTGYKAAATIMAMNNVYYRFIHLNEDEAFAKMPAKLRMNVMMNPGIEKNDFELASLAVSAINGCGMCMKSHREVLQKNGVANEAIQEAVRIASVAAATAQALVIH